MIKIDLSPLLFFFERARAWEREGMTAVGKSEKHAGRNEQRSEARAAFRKSERDGAIEGDEG